MPLDLYEPGSEAAWLRSFSWSTRFRPRFAETDALGHVSNVSYMSYIEIGRLDYFNQLSDPARDAHLFGFMHNAAEVTVRFVRPCFYDEELRIHTKVAKVGTSSAILEHAITGPGESDVRTLARVAIVCMRDDRSAPWSDAQRTILQRELRA